MSKDNHASYYYTYTSPSTVPPSTPSAPSADDLGSSSSGAPPAYDDAVQQVALPDNHKADDSNSPYVRDDSFSDAIPAYNPANIPDADDNADPEQPLISDPFRGRPPPPGYSVYRAPYETLKDSTILSRDKHLNVDGEALVQFLKQRNTPPLMSVRFHGYHEETHWRTRNTRDSDGNLVEEREPVTRRIDDFCFEIDCSEYVSPQCEGMYVLPDRKTGITKSVRELCDEYVHEQNQLKELRLTKLVEWDYAQLTRAFTAAIRSYGYYHAVEISFEMKEHKIIVKTDSGVSRMVDNWMVRWFFFLSCLWIIAWPVLWLFRKKFGDNSLQSKWTMLISESDWYNQKVHEVLGQVRHQGQAFGTVPFIL